MPSYIGPKIAQDGLILYLDAADRNSYSGGGSNWFNLVSNTKTGILGTGVNFENSNGGVMNFFGSGGGSLVQCGQASTYYPLSTQAYEIWIKSSGLGPGQSTAGLIAIDYGMYMQISSAGNLNYSVYSTELGFPGITLVSRTATVTPNLFNNQWRHVVCTSASSGTYEMYVDGSILASGTVTGVSSNSTFWPTLTTRIGDNPNNVFYKLNGKVSNAKIYNRKLSQEEVRNNYNAQRGRFNV